jgi:putative CocE/NonD family hydrolase
MSRSRICCLLVLFTWRLILSTPSRAQTAEAWTKSGLEDVATFDRENMVAMRDGVRLSTSLLIPKTPVGKMPAILIRTPYERGQELNDKLVRPLLSRGYVIVLQNERGTGWSEGQHQFLAGARNDGYDTLTWITQQPWSNGRVGTIGCSSSAEHQLALASMNHPAHKAMVAMGPGSGVGEIPGWNTEGGFYKGGVPMIEWEEWYRFNGEFDRPKLPPDASRDERIRLVDLYTPWAAPESRTELKRRAADSIRQLPSKDIETRIGVPPNDFDTLITLSPVDPHWRELDLIHDGDHPRVPALYVDAWHDFTGSNTIKLFEYLQGTPNQFLIVAPTGHCEMREATEHTMVGERDMSDGRFDYDNLILKWFDRWLQGKNNDVLDRPKVQTFLMGGNRWQTFPSWPPPAARPTKFYLHSDGRANSVLGNGRLSISEPSRETPDAFISNPFNPVPSSGGGDALPNVQDQTPVETRDDVLVYSTEPLKEGLAITGEIKVVLFVSSTAPDADLSLKLVDVYPDGKAYNVSDTMLRLRYRDGFKTAVFMKPGEVYRAEPVRMITSNYFAPGHRLRIHIAGSNFPLYERNLQTGGRNHDETQGRSATLSIYHDSNHGSYIEVPVTGP